MNTAGMELPTGDMEPPNKSSAWLIPPLLVAAFVLAKGALPNYDGPSETRPRVLMRLLLALASLMTALHLAPLLAANGEGQNDGKMESLSSLKLFGNATIADMSRALLLLAIVLLPAFLALAGELRRWRPPPESTHDRVRSASQGSASRAKDGSRRTPRQAGTAQQEQRRQPQSRTPQQQVQQPRQPPQRQQQQQQQAPQVQQQPRQQQQQQQQQQQLQQQPPPPPRVRMQAELPRQQASGSCTFSFPTLESGATRQTASSGSGPPRGFPIVAPREASDEDIVRLATWLYFDGSSTTLKSKMQQVRDAVAHNTTLQQTALGSASTASAQAADGEDSDRGPVRTLHEPVDDYLLARFLLAAKFEVPKAAEYLNGYLDWRKQQGGPVIPPRQWINMAAVLVPFQDKVGRPVVVLRLRHLSPSTVPLDLFELGFCATLDAVIAHYLSMRLQGTALSGSREPGVALEQYACVIDATGATQKNFALPALKMMQRMATTRYPERVGNIYVLGANLGVRTLWRMVRPLLLERTQGNINIIGAADVPKTFAELVGPRAVDLLPPEYGGRAPPWPSPMEAVTLEEKAGPLAAQAWRWLGSVDPKVYPGGPSPSPPAGPSIDGAVVSAASVASISNSVQNAQQQSQSRPRAPSGGGQLATPAPTLPVPARRRQQHPSDLEGSTQTNGHTNGNHSNREISRGISETSNCESCFQWFRKKRI